MSLVPKEQLYANVEALWGADGLARLKDEIDAYYATQSQLEADREQSQVNLAQIEATLRSWAADARATTVTAGNAVTVLQTLVKRLGTLCDGLADLIRVTR